MSRMRANALARTGLVAAMFLGATASGLAFALWAEQGTGVFRALVETGLAWCF
jgi:hypothetical protein